MKPFTADLAAAPWSMEPGHLQRFFASLDGLGISDGARAATFDASRTGNDPGPFVADGIARIEISGMLMKSVPPWMDYTGIAATGYDRISAAIAAAEADPTVDAIQFVFDTPGGAVAGMQAVVDQIAACRKPTQALCEDLCASAGYAPAAQCDQVIAIPGTMIGSIGIYRVAIDASRMAENSGVKVHVISSGPHKGSAFGATISPEALNGMQKNVDDLTALFIAGISSGRGMSQDKVKSLATGEVWLAAEAVTNGLIDAVMSTAAARASLSKLAAAARTNPPTGRAFAPAGNRTTPAGAKPATKESTMSMTKERMAELSKANPSHQALIIEMFAADKPEADIVAAMAAAETAGLRAAVTDLNAKLAKAGTDMQAAIAAKDAALAESATKLAAVTKERDDLKALGTVPAVPADATPPKATGQKVQFTKAQAQAGKIPKAHLEAGDYELID